MSSRPRGWTRPPGGPGGNYRPPLPWGGPPPGLGCREGEGQAGGVVHGATRRERVLTSRPRGVVDESPKGNVFTVEPDDVTATRVDETPRWPGGQLSATTAVGWPAPRAWASGQAGRQCTSCNARRARDSRDGVVGRRGVASPDKGDVRTVEPDDVTSHEPSDVAARPLYGPGGNQLRCYHCEQMCVLGPLGSPSCRF